MNSKFLFTALLLFFFTSSAFSQSGTTPSGKGLVSVTEEDGSPDTYPWQVKVPNSSLTDNSDGTVSIGYGGSDLRYLKLVDAASTTSGSAGCSLIGIPILGSATYDRQCDFNDSFGSCGRKTGGAITDAGSSKVAVTAGTGFIKATDDDNAELLSFNWSAPANITIPADSTRYIGVEYNAGVPQVVARTSFNWNLDSEFPLGRVINDTINSTEELYIANAPWWITDGMTNVTEAIRSFGLIRRDETIGGLMLSVTGTRSIKVTAGTIWTGLNELEYTGVDTNVTGTVEYYWYKAGTGWQASDVTQYSVLQWNDVTQTTLQDISLNKYCNVWVYGEVSGASLGIALIYPQAQYNTAAAAEAVAAPTNLPTHITEIGKLIGRIIIKQGVDAPIAVQSVFTTTFASSVVTDHNNLSGLQGGVAGEYYHATSAEYTATATTGSGNLARLTSPQFTTPNIGVATATSVAIGANTLTTAEWANLDGQDQAVKTTSNPTFGGLTIGSGSATAFGLIGNNFASAAAGALNPGVYVYKNGTTAYGMKLQYARSEYGTTIFGPNQADRFISFGKIGAALEDDDVTEYVILDLDTGEMRVKNYLMLGVTGTTNGVANCDDSLYFNCDADNSATGTGFVWGHNRGTATFDTNVLMVLYDSAQLVVGGTTAQSGYELTVINDIYAGGDVSALTFTDRATKFDGDALAAIKTLKYRQDNETDYEQLDEFMISRDKDGEIRGKNLGNMVLVSMEAIKQLETKNQELEARITALEKKING